MSSELAIKMTRDVATPSSSSFPCLIHRCLSDIEELSKRDQAMKHLKDIFSWHSDGRSFRIHSKQKFIEVIMPSFFPRIKYSSFVRQLSTYGFKKIPPRSGALSGALYHELFQRGMPELARDIKKVPKSNQRNRAELTQSYEGNAAFASVLISATQKQSQQRMSVQDYGSSAASGPMAQPTTAPTTSLVELVRGSRHHLVESSLSKSNQWENKPLPCASYLPKVAPPTSYYHRNVNAVAPSWIPEPEENLYIPQCYLSSSSCSSGQQVQVDGATTNDRFFHEDKKEGGDDNPFLSIVLQNLNTDLAAEESQDWLFEPSVDDLDAIFQEQY